MDRLGAKRRMYSRTDCQDSPSDRHGIRLLDNSRRTHYCGLRDGLHNPHELIGLIQCHIRILHLYR